VLSPVRSLGQRLIAADDGVFVFLVRLLLTPLQLLYRGVTGLRNALYDDGLLSVTGVDAPVVSVGNLTVGGTGKTPMVILLARRALAAGKRVAVVQRDYGAAADAEGRPDEAALVAARCPGVMAVVVRNKRSGAQQAVAAGADFVIVDDGLQHRSLRRDFEIVMLDARAPFGSGRLLPSGSLREAASGLARADVAVLTHGEDLDAGMRDTVAAHVRAFRLDLPLVWARHVPVAVRPVTGGPAQPPTSLAGRDVFLFCGIASPDGFRSTVEALGATVTGLVSLGDHHAIDGRDLAAIRARALLAQSPSTEKDAAKVARIAGNDDVLCLEIELQLESQLPPIPGLDGPWSGGHPAADDHSAHH